MNHVKLYSKLLDNPVVCKDADHLAVWCYLLLKSSSKEIEVLNRGEKTTLKPGQLLTTKREIADFLKVSPSKIQRILKSLEIDLQIEQVGGRRKRLITILNWNGYQDSGPESGPGVVQKWSNSGPEVVQNQVEEKDDSKALKKKEKDETDYKAFVDEWNKLGISKHTYENKKLRAAYKKLKVKDRETVIMAAKRYRTAYLDDRYFYKVTWTLDKFIKQDNGYVDWLDEGSRWIDYTAQFGTPKPQKERKKGKLVVYDTIDDVPDSGGRK